MKGVQSLVAEAGRLKQSCLFASAPTVFVEPVCGWFRQSAHKLNLSGAADWRAHSGRGVPESVEMDRQWSLAGRWAWFILP
jgi:hypothetical protein